MKRQQVFFSNKLMACKWMDNRSVLLLSTALEGLNDFSTVQQREKGYKSKSVFPCPKLVVLYNDGMRGVNLMVQRKP